LSSICRSRTNLKVRGFGDQGIKGIHMTTVNVGPALNILILICITLLPSLLAMRLAKKQNRSVLTSGIVTFILGLTVIGGWLYLAIMNLYAPKPEEN